jgi:HEAT repeat protein
MRRYLYIGLAVAGLGVLAGIIIARLAPAPPIYGGKTVKTWALQLNAPEPQRRDEAAAAFHALGSNAVPALVRLLRAKDSFLRKQLWQHAPQWPAPLQQIVLARVRAPEAVLHQRSAARALGVIGLEAAAAVPDLARALRAKDAEVRFESGRALGQIGTAGVGELAAALSVADPDVRYAAVCGLGEAQADRNMAVLALLQGIGDQSDGVRIAAGGSLSRLGTNVLPLVLRELESGTAARRLSASKAIGIVRPDRASVLPALFNLARDPDPACRLAAIQALGGQGIPNDKMVEAFSDALTDSVTEVRLAALYPLFQLRGRAAPAVPNLTACLSDPSPKIRQWSARTLGAIGAAAGPAVTALNGLAADPEQSVRSAASEAVASIAKGLVDESGRFPVEPDR